MNRRIEARRNNPGAVFDPLIGIVDDAQVAFMCPVKDEEGRPYGGSKATSRHFMGVRKVHNQGRAVDVILWEGTQDPTDQNFPKLAREGAHTHASLALGTESQARMALGDKAVDGGAAPHLGGRRLGVPQRVRPCPFPSGGLDRMEGPPGRSEGP